MRRWIIGVSLVCLLSACQTPIGEPKDGAPLTPKPVAHIPNAVPKVEPKSKYGNPPSYSVFGKRYHVKPHAQNFTEEGLASWYGTKFHGRRTSSGEPYDMYAMTAAHKHLPLPTYVRVTNLENDQEIIVKVNDRGPFHEDRIIDLSYAAARKLGVTHLGTAKVKVEAIDPLAFHNKSYQQAITRTNPEHYLQVGAFSEHGNALDLARQVQEAINHPVDTQIAVENGRKIYKVQIGPFTNIESSDSAYENLTAKGFERAITVTR